MPTTTRGRLLNDAVSKPVQRFRQYDAWVPLERFAADYITGSHDGHIPTITFGDVDELRNGTPVRVQIAMDVPAAEAVLALRTIANCIEAEGEFAVLDLSEHEPPF